MLTNRSWAPAAELIASDRPYARQSFLPADVVNIDLSRGSSERRVLSGIATPLEDGGPGGEMGAKECLDLPHMLNAAVEAIVASGIARLIVLAEA
jgi:hypothetical protein